ncbi:MAG: hypothetical protein WD187_00770 [Candidatus Woykebacteria bacterium]
MSERQKGISKLLIIFIVFLLITLLVGILMIAKNFSKDSQDAKAPTVEIAGILLNITSPADGVVTDESSISVEGTTGKDAVVAITGGKEDVIAETKGGRFEAKINLAEGETQVSIYAFDEKTGESSQATVNVLYLQEIIAARRVLVAAETTDVVEKNKERIEDLKDKLATQSSELKKAATTFKKTHVFGTLTALGSSTLTIETAQGDIKNIFTDDFTKFLSISTKGKSTVALENLRAGDKISVVGISNDDTSGTAKFVVVVKKALAKRHAVLGNVKEIDGNSITLTHLVQTDREFSVVAAKNVSIETKGQENAATITDIKVGDVIVAVGSVDTKGQMTATKVFIAIAKREISKPTESTSSATPSANQ